MGKLYSWCLMFLTLFTFQDGLSKKHGHLTRSSDSKIVGGYATAIEKAPYQAFLLLQRGSDYFQCGGSIISRRYILTAAHCVQDMQKIHIRVGSADSYSGGTNYVTTRYIQHPQYNSRTTDYDVALIRLRKNMNIDGTTTKIVGLPPSNTQIPEGTEVLVTGWGTTSENGEATSTLMAVEVPVVSNAECSRSYTTITDRMLCAGIPEGGKDACQGDSGGPAVSTESGLQLGIVSFGIGCARPGIPGVYTNVSTVRNWIRRTARV